jgi:hypothetical protein
VWQAGGSRSWPEGGAASEVRGGTAAHSCSRAVGSGRYSIAAATSHRYSRADTLPASNNQLIIWYFTTCYSLLALSGCPSLAWPVKL